MPGYLPDSALGSRLSAVGFSRNRKSKAQSQEPPQIYSPAVSKAGRGSKPTNKKPNASFPWIVFLLLLVTIYLFWIYPIQRGRSPVRVSFEPAPSSSK